MIKIKKYYQYFYSYFNKNNQKKNYNGSVCYQVKIKLEKFHKGCLKTVKDIFL